MCELLYICELLCLKFSVCSCVYILYVPCCTRTPETNVTLEMTSKVHYWNLLMTRKIIFVWSVSFSRCHSNNRWRVIFVTFKNIHTLAIEVELEQVQAYFTLPHFMTLELVVLFISLSLLFFSLSLSLFLTLRFEEDDKRKKVKSNTRRACFGQNSKPVVVKLNMRLNFTLLAKEVNFFKQKQSQIKTTTKTRRRRRWRVGETWLLKTVNGLSYMYIWH